jgi:hypothetical protein
MAYDDRDRRYSIHETDETIEQRQQRWIAENPGKELPVQRTDDGYASIVWKTHRLEATMQRVEHLLMEFVNSNEGLGADVAEKLGKHLKSQFTVPSEKHYAHHMYIDEQMENKKDVRKRNNDIILEVLKWIVLGLLAIIVGAISGKVALHIN